MHSWISNLVSIPTFKGFQESKWWCVSCTTLQQIFTMWKSIIQQRTKQWRSYGKRCIFVYNSRYSITVCINFWRKALLGNSSQSQHFWAKHTNRLCFSTNWTQNQCDNCNSIKPNVSTNIFKSKFWKRTTLIKPTIGTSCTTNAHVLQEKLEVFLYLNTQQIIHN
jgi:hypothetical protein